MEKTAGATEEGRNRRRKNRTEGEWRRRDETNGSGRTWKAVQGTEICTKKKQNSNGQGVKKKKTREQTNSFMAWYVRTYVTCDGFSFPDDTRLGWAPQRRLFSIDCHGHGQ